MKRKSLDSANLENMEVFTGVPDDKGMIIGENYKRYPDRNAYLNPIYRVPVVGEVWPIKRVNPLDHKEEFKEQR